MALVHRPGPGLPRGTMRDVDVRGELHRHLSHKFAHDPTTVIVDELGICQGAIRVDVAAVNGSLYGYEIKAAADTLKRLANQIQAYSRVFDYAFAVVAPNHLDEATKMVPSWWGVILSSQGVSGLRLTVAKRAKKNPRIEARSLAELLWHEEALTLLEQRQCARGLRGKRRSFAWDRLCEVYTLDEIRSEVRKSIKARQVDRSASEHATDGALSQSDAMLSDLPSMAHLQRTA